MAQNTTTSSTDLLIRFLHIVIILSFSGAYLTGDAEEWHQVHMAFGYTLGIGLILRILWQFFAPRLAHTQPSGVSRRFHVIKPFVQRYWAQPQQWLSQTFLKAASSSLFQLSILGVFCLLPLTVLAGFLTDYTHSHSLKEVHELFANVVFSECIATLGSIVTE